MFSCYLHLWWVTVLKWKNVWLYDVLLFCFIYASSLDVEDLYCKCCFSQNLPKREIVRFIDLRWPHFVKTRVIARCQRRCLDMLVCDIIVCLVPLSWNLFFKRDIPEYSLKIWFRCRVDQEACDSRSNVRRFICVVFLKCYVVTFALLHDFVLKTVWFIWMFGPSYASCPLCV